MRSAAYDDDRVPSAIVHAPPGFDPERPLRLVLFLHGWSGCARVLVRSGRVECGSGGEERDGWDLAGSFDAAEVNALLVVPQLALLRRDGDPGRFGERGGFRTFVAELLTALAPRIGPITLERVHSVTLLAHSAGFETALALLARGDVTVQHVVLFDALYRGVEPFLAWAEADPGRRLISLFTGRGRTAAQSQRLARLAERRFAPDEVRYLSVDPLAEQVRRARVVISRSDAPHRWVPRRHAPQLLPALLVDRVTLRP